MKRANVGEHVGWIRGVDPWLASDHAGLSDLRGRNVRLGPPAHLPGVEESRAHGQVFRIERDTTGEQPVRYFIDGRRVEPITWHLERYAP